MTEKLYYQDVELLRFTARVLDCREEKGGWAVTLSRTAFYPEGGGQPADQGTLGESAVLDVQERGDAIEHLCTAPLPVGAEVTGQVDGARRRDLMEQHSGEHMVSGLICAAFSCSNVGFHIGGETVTIDFDAEFTMEQLLPLERRANALIREDVPVEIFTPAPAELEKLHYRSKKAIDGPVRLVRFPGADLCACCGLHVRRTGELGLVKFLSCIRSRGGVRIELKCGRRAVEHVLEVWEQNAAVSRLTSAKPLETARAVERLQEELRREKERAARWEGAAFSARAEQYRGAGDVLLLEPPLTPDSARRLATAVAEAAGGRCAVFAGAEGEGRHYAVVTRREEDLRPLAKALNAALSGRGGGRSDCIQGTVAAGEEEIRRFFAGR